MPTSDADPRSWTLGVPTDRIDLCSELKDELRPLTATEAGMMVELIDAWRSHEHRKHIALMAALSGDDSNPDST